MKFNLFFLVTLLVTSLNAQSTNEECFACHSDVLLTGDRNGRQINLYVSPNTYKWSVHSGLECIDCHAGFDAQDLPHKEGERIYRVDCSPCHSRAVSLYRNSLHGQAHRQGKYLAPSCQTCHGKHDILSSSDTRSKTYVFNIPTLCGSCHKEGTTISEMKEISQHHILENYSLSIHGEGLFERGLTVTAVCNSCHSTHNILPHENPNSSINKNNIAGTCMKCHAQIEEVHKKVIAGELWEKEPHKIPACIECHQPHKIRRVFYDEHFADQMCMDCHENQDIHKMEDGKRVNLHVDPEEIYTSAHAKNTCVKCHTNVDEANDPVCINSGKVDCSICHSEETNNYYVSDHGTAYLAGDTTSPYCTDCHNDHHILAKTNPLSPTYFRNIPNTCVEGCHILEDHDMLSKSDTIMVNYRESKHGEGLMQSGLTVTATCVSCHTAHLQFEQEDERSSVNRDNIGETCADCHVGIYEQFSNSIHSREYNDDTDKQLPVCYDCHSSHLIVDIEKTYFRTVIIDQCGGCHPKVTESYFDTYHGKVSQLGSVTAARCGDCHGSHNILPPSNPNSTLSRDNIVETCQQCHPNSNKMFTGYLTHATHHDKDKYPWLFYTFWFMTILLIATFTFFGLHTLLWLPRAIKERKKYKEHRKQLEHEKGTKYFERFDGFSRILHVLVVVSFLSLAITGMTIKFAGVPIFQTLSDLMGGTEVTGYIHRVAAIITFVYFFLHIYDLIKKKKRQGISWKKFIADKNAMLPNKRDWVEFKGTLKWFLGKGPRPDYGKWTYWEKFDYFAVFWGVTVIGSTGLLLWFSEFFTSLGIPGWLINVATIVHSDEALLAAGFIFTIHFFNTHFRPDRFPMDDVIFTGSIPVEEMKIDRPRQYEDLVEKNQLEEHIVGKPTETLRKVARIFGFTALFFGIATIIMIIVAMLFFYM